MIKNPFNIPFATTKRSSKKQQPIEESDVIMVLGAKCRIVSIQPPKAIIEMIDKRAKGWKGNVAGIEISNGEHTYKVRAVAGRRIYLSEVKGEQEVSNA